MRRQTCRLVPAGVHRIERREEKTGVVHDACYVSVPISDCLAKEHRDGLFSEREGETTPV
jgi:hypothetical protein